MFYSTEPPPQRCRFILLCSAISCHIVLRCHFVHHNAEPGASPASHSRAHRAWAPTLGEAQRAPASTPGSGDAGKPGRGEPDPKTQPLKEQACALGVGIESSTGLSPPLSRSRAMLTEEREFFICRIIASCARTFCSRGINHFLPAQLTCLSTPFKHFSEGTA